MTNTMRVGNTTYEIDDNGQAMLCITRRGVEGKAQFYLPRALVLEFAREHLVRGLVRAMERSTNTSKETGE